MAKITHNNYIDTINDIVDTARQRKVMHLTYDSEEWRGRKIHVGNEEMINFGTCGYLGLEIDQRLIDKSVDYVKRYGSQFSISRAYVVNHEVNKLENLLSQIFDGRKSLVFSSTTLTHISVLPIVVGSEDAIILDQQSHFSIQNAANLMSKQGVPIEVIRHSNLEMLEQKILELGNKFEKVWYMIDGVYSMYGDVPPIEDINQLMKKYPQLHLYVDDAHGMGWTGKNGSGNVFSKVKDNGKTVLISTLAKGFGSLGGIAVFPNTDLYDKVQTFGGPLGYSHPLAPAVLGASIAAAEIHLSSEIYNLQNRLSDKIEFCNELLDEAGFPVLSNPKTPIYFIGCGKPNVGYNLNNRMIDHGFYVNLAVFPAVSMKNTGLRFTITQHVSKKDIYEFVESLRYHYPRALAEENVTENDVRDAFRLPKVKEEGLEFSSLLRKKVNSPLFVEYFTSVEGIGQKIWNSLIQDDEGHYDYDAMLMLEKSFSNNVWEEHNWDFHYYLVRDSNQKVVASTYLTSGLIKDDLFAFENVSKQIEEKRRQDRYCLTSEALVMGSLFSEGEHLIIDEQHPESLQAVEKILVAIKELQEKIEVNSIVLRDFPSDNKELESLFHDYGYLKTQMPNANIIFDINSNRDKEFVTTLTPKSRRHIRGDVFKHSDKFQFEIKNQLSDDELEHLYKHYLEVVRRNLAVNLFNYPKKVFKEMNSVSSWEFAVLSLKSEDPTKEAAIQGVICCYKQGRTYSPILLAMDYTHNGTLKVYKQFLYQVANYARNEGYSTVHFGYSADTEKKKLGAIQVSKFAYVQINDHFNMEIISQMSNNR